jgi:hypothetical protein
VPAIGSNNYAARPPREPSAPPVPQGAPLRGGLAPAPHPFFRALSSQPFAPAQRQAQQRVERTQRQLPKQPTPNIPRLPNPTRQQAEAALHLARNAQRLAVGANPTGERIRSYQSELLSDPRQRDYVSTLQHYASALAAHEGHPVGAAAHAVANARPEAPGMGLPLIGTVVPGHFLEQLATSEVGQHLLKSYGELAKPASAIARLAKGEVGYEPSPHGNLLLNALVDAGQLPAGVISSLAETGRGAVEAGTTGNTDRLAGIGKGILHSIEHPVETLKTRPVSTALMFAGGEEAAGRLAGAALRKGALGAKGAEFASTSRPDLQFYNGMGLARKWNPDIVRKGVQALSDKALTKAPGDYRQLDPNQATGARLARHVKGGLVKPGEVDYSVDSGEQYRKALKSQAVKAVEDARPVKAAGGDVAAAVATDAAQRVARNPETLVPDLELRRSQLQEAQAGRYTTTGLKMQLAEPKPLEGKALADNQASIGRLTAAVAAAKAGKLDTHAPFHAGETFGSQMRPLTQGLQQVGALDPAQERAALFPYAQTHMEARPFTVEDHVAAEKIAKGREQAAVAHAESLPLGPEKLQAGRRAEALREVRREVAGRGHPEDMVAHEGILQEHAEARKAVTVAQEGVRQAEAARSRLVGAYGRARPAHDQGAKLGTAPLDSTAGGRMAAAEAKVTGAREALRVANERHVDARTAAAASKPPKTMPGLRYPDGRYLSSEDIRAHMARNGVAPPHYVSHEPRIAGRGSFFKRTTTRPAIYSQRRAGVSFAQGTHEGGYGALLGTVAKAANDLAGHTATDARLSQFGIGSKGYGSLEDAASAKEGLEHNADGTPNPVVQALGPLEAHPIGPERVRAKGRVNPGDAEALRRQLGAEPRGAAQAGTHAGAKYVLLPKMVVDRLKEHDALLGPSEGTKLYQKVTNQWRQTGLFTSPRWLLGDPQEHGIRLAIARASPRFMGGVSGKMGKRLGEAWDGIGASNDPLALQANLVKNQLIRGTIFGSAQELEMRRTSDQFANSPIAGPALHQIEEGKRSLPGKVVLGPWHAWKAGVGKGMRALEHQSREAAVGRQLIPGLREHAAEMGVFLHKWESANKLMDNVVNSYARGQLSPPKAAANVRAVDDMMGAYGHLTPTVRKAVQTWSPFGLWWLTSMRFLRKMPLDHPTQTAVYAALHNALAPGEANGSKPGYLVGGIHLNLPGGIGGVTINPTRYSPMGAGQEPFKTMGDMVAPLQTETLGTLAGVDMFGGKELSAAHGKKVPEAERPEILLNKLLEGLVPGYRQAQIVRQGGGKPYGNSTLWNPKTKEGSAKTVPQLLYKLLSPESSVFDPAAKGTTTTGRAADPFQQSRREAAKAEHAAASDPFRESRRREAREAAGIR